MGGVRKNLRKEMPEWHPASDAGSMVPPLGWIRTTRHAKGLSLRNVGDRLGIAGNSVYVAEKREREGGISIGQLRRLAAAMDCRLIYAFVPVKTPGEPRTTRGSKSRS